MVLWSLKVLGGEIFVPKIPSYRITDVAEAISPSATKIIVGTRPGEKIHEEMITTSDSISTIDIGQYYVILPDDLLKARYLQQYSNAQAVPSGFSIILVKCRISNH